MRTSKILSLIGATVVLSAFAPPEDSDWHQWRGPNRDNLSPDTGLLKQWPAAGPPRVWKTSGLGKGYSSVSISGNRIFTMGESGGNQNLIALNATDGKAAWSIPVGVTGGSHGGGPRSTPATDGERVYAIGHAGEFVCANAADGKVIWKKHLVQEFGGRKPGWSYSESPLLDGDNVICTPGGKKGSVLALNKKTGATVWQSTGIRDTAQYCSLVPAEIGGVRQYLLLTMKSVAGIAASDGKVLWRADRQGKTAICSTPIYRDGLLFVSSGYGVGCNAFKITASGGTFKAEQVYSGKQMRNHHGGMILLGDYLYALEDGGKMTCIDFKTGKVAWAGPRFSKGAIAYADGHFVIRSENKRNGTLALVEATPAGYKEKGRFDQPDLSGQATWPHPVIAGGRLYVRDQDALFCYNLKAR